MKLQDRLRDANSIGAIMLPWCFALMSGLLLVTSLIMIFQGRVAEASLAGGLFFLCVVLAYFPQLESVKALSVDVKLRKSLDRADDILAKVRSITEIYARHSLYSMAHFGRMSGSPLTVAPELIDGVLEHMQDAGLTEVDRRSAADPLLRMVSRDLADQYGQTLLRYLGANGVTTPEIQKKITPINIIVNSVFDRQKALDLALREMQAFVVVDDQPYEVAFSKLRDYISQLYDALNSNLRYPAAIGQYLARRDLLEFVRERFL